MTSAAVPNVSRYRRMLKAKIHRIVVTEANLAYEGSLTVDARLLGQADLVEFEAVEVANLSTGDRFTTYVIPGAAGECCLNGGAARLGAVGDLLIVMAFDLVAEADVASRLPHIVHADARP